MRRVANVCLGLGLLTVTAGIGMVLYPMLSAYLAERPLFQTSILLGESAYSPWLQTSDPALRVGLGVTLAPRFAAREWRREGDGELIQLYRFPLHYRVRDEDGNTLIDQWILLDGGANRTLPPDYNELAEPVTVTVNAMFDPFRMPAGKRVRLEALLLPDRHYSAELLQAELRMFRQPLPALILLRQGMAAVFTGLGLMLLGFAAEARAGSRTVVTKPAVQPTPVWTFPTPAPRQPMPSPVLRQAL